MKAKPSKPWCNAIQHEFFDRDVTDMSATESTIGFLWAKFSPVTSNMWIPIRNIKHRLITKLITQIEANLRD